MATKKIVIITQSHLCRNPRVLKEALLLAAHAYEIEIVTTFSNNVLLAEDLELIKNSSIKITPVVDLRLASVKNLWIKFQRKVSVLLIQKFKLETTYALGYGINQYWKYLKIHPSDLFICHQELATYIGVKLLEKGKKVTFDFEDWYSKDLLPEAQKKRPLKILEKTESKALKFGNACWTTSQSLAQALAKYYSCGVPEIIYNVFPKPNIIPKEKKIDKFQLLWFSQTIGPGRGLEELIIGLKKVEGKFCLHLLGNVNASYRNLLIELSNNQFSIEFHEIVSVKELPKFIANFNLGLALELSQPASRDLTITNKFFQYIQSGLPILASDTKGQKEIMNHYPIGALIKIKDLNWHEELQYILDNPSYYIQLKNHIAVAAKQYNWEIEQQKLLAIINSII